MKKYCIINNNVCVRTKKKRVFGDSLFAKITQERRGKVPRYWMPINPLFTNMHSAPKPHHSTSSPINGRL